MNNSYPFDRTFDAPTQLLGEAGISTRREFMGNTGLAVGGLALAITMPPCSKKDLSAWVSTIVASFNEMKPLLPQLGLPQAKIDLISGYLDKAAALARTFDEAYKAGKFKDAIALFGSLSELITSIASELGVVDNRIVKLALVAVAVARIAIATLLKQQASNPAAAAEIARSSKSAEAVKGANEIDRLAAVDVDKLLQAVKP